ncbi:MAG: hypothetical protein HC880_16410 [Bacteroidia bacterium]|nr:hypothetical protein [Bacteroidia bacterium]
MPATDIGEINFSLIPQSTDQIMALLTDTPTFYAPYNLKIYMLNTYQETARQARQWQQTDLYQRYSDWPDNPDAVRIYIDENFRYRRTQFIRGDHAFSWDTRQDINDLLNALRSFPTEASYLPTLRVLYRHLAFATELATQGAYVPQLIRLKSQKFLIRWVPALRIPIVKTLFDQLVALTPPCTLVHFTRQQLCYPDGAEQVRSLLALFLNHLVRTAFRNPNPNGYDPLLFHFFTQQSLENKSAQQRNLLRAIYEWIAPLHQLHPQ